ncbi:endoplasmic reticulum aminopeptidase 2-like [Centruroides sculpturatus]|uniref:endoplasmic reticulum aminopeptidase 2-like n=1 Tax=Centruroides sculpturatus TaxID=218467 RepID=UPI000C6E2544|nr:endoplasmic reticulum aminopeptidase 2-like [Centruroides sculpturatus]XP_023217371.1 endoplasmic reticulum aminopeptidase 2-like [Centruroides sculpturatus]
MEEDKPEGETEDESVKEKVEEKSTEESFEKDYGKKEEFERVKKSKSDRRGARRRDYSEKENKRNRREAKRKKSRRDYSERSPRKTDIYDDTNVDEGPKRKKRKRESEHTRRGHKRRHKSSSASQEKDQRRRKRRKDKEKFGQEEEIIQQPSKSESKKFAIRLLNYKVLIGISLVLIVLAIILVPFYVKDTETCVELRRLPKSFIPKHYDLLISMKTLRVINRYSGTINIVLYCNQSTHAVTLHQTNLFIGWKYIALIDQEGKEHRPKESFTDNVFLTIIFDELLKENRYYNLSISFRNYVRNFTETGIFDLDKTKHILLTNFKAGLARTAFPCFDEPSFKTTFDILILRPKNFTSLSNMPIIQTVSRDNFDEDVFERTPPIATHSVMLVIGKLISLVNGDTVLWYDESSEDVANKSSYKIELAFNWTKRFFGAFPFPKLDIIIMDLKSEDYLIGAGVIVVRKSNVITLSESLDDTIEFLEIFVYNLISQWLGHSVTVDWWSNFWITEGLSKYIASYILSSKSFLYEEIDKISLDTAIENSMGCDNELDSLSLVNARCKNASLEILSKVPLPLSRSVFDVLRHIIGDENFKNGVRKYVQDKALNNTNIEEFWKYFKKYNGSIEYYLKSWINLPGVPIINVVRDYESNTVTITQEPCLSNQSDNYRDGIWNVPLSIIREKGDLNDSKIVLLSRKTMTLRDMPDENQWIYFHEKSLGSYIVNYDNRNWNLLANEIRKKKSLLNPNQKLKLLNDMINLERWGIKTLENPLNLYLFIPRQSIFMFYPIFYNAPDHINIIFISELMEGITMEDYWKEFLWYLYRHAYYKLGWHFDHKNELFIFNKIRMEILEILCRIGERNCVQYCVHTLTVRNSTSRLETTTDKNFKSICICAAIRYGKKDFLDIYWSKYAKEHPLLLIECSTNPIIVREELEKLFVGATQTKFSDRLGSCIHNLFLWEKCFDFVDKHFALFVKKPKFIQFLINTVKRVTPNYKKYKKIIKVFGKYLPSLHEKNKEATEEIFEKYNNTKEIERNTKMVTKWLRKKPWVK